MSSRMGKYEMEDDNSFSRASRNADLYKNNNVDDYNKIDINSNVSILKTEGRDINVDKIREMLDKKYRDNIPQRKSINIEIDEDEDEVLNDPTKEYDINQILAKAKNNKEVDYNEERLRKLRDTNYTILNNLDLKRKEVDETEEDLLEVEEETNKKELRELINTITQLEAKSKKELEQAINDNENDEDDVTEPDLLNLTDENDNVTLPPNDEKDIQIINQNMENSFYTGNLAVKKDDYDDFNDIEGDIKSNSTLIKILIFIFIIIIFGISVFLLDKFLNWGLF